MKHLMPRRHLGTLLLLLLGFVLVGCSDSGSGSDDRSQIRSYYLEMSESDLDELYSRSVRSDDRLPGMLTLSHSDVEEVPVGVRFRGNSTRGEPKKGFSFSFDERQPAFWNADQINARAMWRDPSFIREHLSFWLFNEVGVPAPRTEHFALFINDVFEGLYLQVERIDEHFLEARGLDPEGTLVRDNFRISNSDPCGIGRNTSSVFGNINFSEIPREDAVECLRANFNYRNANWNDVLDLVLWVEGSSPGETFAEELEERVDVENMMRFLAAHILTGDRDALWGNDYWFYKPLEANSKWIFIPWDKNLTLGNDYRPGQYRDPDEPDSGVFNHFFSVEYGHTNFAGGNSLFRMFLDTPSLRNRLEDFLYTTLKSPVFNSGFESEIQKATQRIAAWSFLDHNPDNEFNRNRANAFSLFGDHEDHIEQVAEFRRLKLNHYLKYLDSNAYETGFEGERHTVYFETTTSIAAGETFYLVDNYGFTLGAMTPNSTLEGGVTVSLEARPGSTAAHLTYDWVVEVSRNFSGTLKLYYRNDSPSGTRPTRGPDSNWYTGGWKAIGQQPSIQLSTNPTGIIMSETTARPLINRLDVEVNLPANQPVWFMSN